MSKPLIKFIIGSTRPNRFGPKAADWLMSLTHEHPNATFELIDLAEVNLPLLDEPQSAITGQYANDHTKAWSKQIAEADGFVFITPEYNHGVSAALKNALDFLFAEWRHKPVAFLSYGAEAGGARAVEHLRGVVAQLSMYDLHEHVMFPSYYHNLKEDGTFVVDETHTKSAHTMLEQLIFWSDTMREARAKLAK